MFARIELTAGQILGTIRGLAFMHSLGVVHGDIKAVASSLLDDSAIITLP
jgi:serine/threonine protein kinase